ncbi:hypothetical protein [Clostridium sp. JN-1]|uniref:hypothetical protein n=1 Tax=Clostridium sp. JN-1 TaxID=2483110 RepID=UPI000F0BCFE8|nr:hypothetical protein [Clostridium sp. JN-1]
MLILLGLTLTSKKINPTKATFKEFAEIWLDTYCVNLSPTTIDGYKKYVKYAIKYIGEDIKILLDTNKYQYYIYNEAEFNKLLATVTGTREEFPILLGRSLRLKS